MKTETRNGITIHYDDNGNEIGRTGTVTVETETYRWKSWVEGSKWDISSIQNEIRKFCYTNKIEILDLRIEKAGFLRSTCFFELRGDKPKLLHLQKSLKSLE